MECLENGVSQYPKLEGRFPQVNIIFFLKKIKARASPKTACFFSN